MADEDEVTEALAVIRQELDRIAAMPGSEAKTRAIRELAGQLDGLRDRAGEIRMAEVYRIYDEEKLSLAPLADRVGISKARAGQLIKQHKDEGEKGKPDE